MDLSDHRTRFHPLSIIWHELRPKTSSLCNKSFRLHFCMQQWIITVAVLIQYHWSHTFNSCFHFWPLLPETAPESLNLTAWWATDTSLLASPLKFWDFYHYLACRDVPTQVRGLWGEFQKLYLVCNGEPPPLLQSYGDFLCLFAQQIFFQSLYWLSLF